MADTVDLLCWRPLRHHLSNLPSIPHHHYSEAVLLVVI